MVITMTGMQVLSPPHQILPKASELVRSVLGQSRQLSAETALRRVFSILPDKKLSFLGILFSRTFEHPCYGLHKVQRVVILRDGCASD